MKINMAHLRDQDISFAIFETDAPSRTKHDRDALLHQLIGQARLSGLRVDKAVLAFTEFGQLTFYGTPDLVRFLVARPSALRWTHTLDV